MSSDVKNIRLEEAGGILKLQYGITGKLSLLPGELDRNFRVCTSEKDFILKISRPDADLNTIEFQNSILNHVRSKQAGIEIPEVIRNKKGDFTGSYITSTKEELHIRLLTWIDGKIWSSLTRHSEDLLYSLGEEAGRITAALQDYSNLHAKRDFDWDISNARWTKNYYNGFKGDKRDLITHFYNGFEAILPELRKCRKSVIHNDVNDYNIIVSKAELPKVKAIIDYGDAVETASINDLAVCITYAIMEKTDPLEAALPVIRGYNKSFPLKEEELNILYWLIGSRLIISLTKSKINIEKEPDNTYLTISEKPAWDLLRKWKKTDPEIAKAFFRNACSFPAHKNREKLEIFANKNSLSLKDFLNEEPWVPVYRLDLDISSSTIAELSTYRNKKKYNQKIKQIWEEQNYPLIVGGYNEIRPEFLTSDYLKKTNNGNFWKNLLLGTELWLFRDYMVTAPFRGKIISAGNKTVVLEHETEIGFTFFSIFRNLIPDPDFIPGQFLEAGDVLGNFSTWDRIEDYSPLFFQLSLLHPQKTTPETTCIADHGEIFRELYPSAEGFFEDFPPATNENRNSDRLKLFRKDHLGKSLSLSYKKPLKMVRGDGIYLVDHTGRKYMDMVNNVAHVGHEHPEVVKAGQVQMAMLNTNSRYLHDNISKFAHNLLSTLPSELSVVHFVNSGSEANELAIRMAKICTGQKDFIAVEAGYHGNSNACIDISSYKFEGKGGSGAPEHTHIVPLPDEFRGRYTGRDCGTRYASHVEEQISLIQKKGRGPAAFICESIISCGGQIELPENYLKAAYAFTREAGGLCIADEVQVGCGRVGSAFWGFELHGVVPDIVTIGKPIGNGHPLAAVVCTKKVAEAFANGMEYFNTFGGNPVSCAIGNKVLEVIKNENLQENALITGNHLKDQLNQLRQQFPIIGNVRGQGLFLGFELTDTNRKPLPDKASYLVERMRDLGILMSTDGPDNNVLKIKPPLVFNRDHSEEFMETLGQVMDEDFMKNYK